MSGFFYNSEIGVAELDFTFTCTRVRIPGVMKKFDQNANFQNCDLGVEMWFSVTFRDIPKIGKHGSNSHLAPNVCFGNDTFF